MRIFMTGATGFIGSRLQRDLLRRGDQVVCLTRDRRRMPAASAGETEERLKVVEGDPQVAGPWQGEITGCDAVIALHGEPLVGKRWTQDFKQRAEDSRVQGMKRIAEAMAEAPGDPRPRALLSASAVGYYGPHGDEPVTEADGPGDDFPARICVRWEAAAKEAAAQGVCVTHLRIGVVLGEGGGALQKMLPAFRAFVGGPIGSGKQYMSWIHMDDVVGIILHCLLRDTSQKGPDLSGPVNVTAPNPATMRELSHTLGQVLHRPALLPVPGFAIKALFGEASSVLLTGQRALPRRALDSGYRFRYPHLLPALSALLAPGGRGGDRAA